MFSIFSEFQYVESNYFPGFDIGKVITFPILKLGK